MALGHEGGVEVHAGYAEGAERAAVVVLAVGAQRDGLPLHLLAQRRRGLPAPGLAGLGGIDAAQAHGHQGLARLVGLKPKGVAIHHAGDLAGQHPRSRLRRQGHGPQTQCQEERCARGFQTWPPGTTPAMGP